LCAVPVVSRVLMTIMLCSCSAHLGISMSTQRCMVKRQAHGEPRSSTDARVDRKRATVSFGNATRQVEP